MRIYVYFSTYELLEPSLKLSAFAVEGFVETGAGATVGGTVGVAASLSEGVDTASGGLIAPRQM